MRPLVHYTVAGYKIGMEHQVLLRRSGRATKARRFMRPDGGPDSLWRDHATTAQEESGKAGKIPGDVTMPCYAAPFLPVNFTMRESEMDNACVPTVRPVRFKKEPVDKEPPMVEDIEEEFS